jgi:hypothetical protein
MAIRHLQKALELDPDHSQCSKLLKMLKKMEAAKQRGNDAFKVCSIIPSVVENVLFQQFADLCVCFVRRVVIKRPTTPTLRPFRWTVLATIFCPNSIAIVRPLCLV